MPSIQPDDASLYAEGVTFAFGDGPPAVSSAHLQVRSGERVALVGPSGCGKSTLLHLLAGILVPQAGHVTVSGATISSLTQDQRAAIRLRDFGFVFQFGELLPELTLRENIELPIRLTRRSARSLAEADPLLSSLGIGDVADRFPSQVSGGQRQRAAIARALIHRPRVVFADEPTGALDQAAGRAALDALLELSSQSGASIVLVTHDDRVASRLDRVVTMRDGSIVS